MAFELTESQQKQGGQQLASVKTRSVSLHPILNFQ